MHIPIGHGYLRAAANDRGLWPGWAGPAWVIASLGGGVHSAFFLTENFGGSTNGCRISYHHLRAERGLTSLVLFHVAFVLLCVSCISYRAPLYQVFVMFRNGEQLHLPQKRRGPFAARFGHGGSIAGRGRGATALARSHARHTMVSPFP